MIRTRFLPTALMIACAVTFASSTIAPAQPAAGGAQPTLLGQFGDWGAYTASPGGRKVCFALSKPTSSATNPPGRNRDQPYFFVSTRPSENVREEASVIVGYPLRPNSDVTAQVGSTTFLMYSQNDGAWIKNPAEESAMIEAMRKGADMTVKGVSGRGTETTDVFSLSGFTQATQRIAQECK
jgi:invasion protein IalB